MRRLSEKNEKIIELASKISSLGDVKTFNKSFIDKVRFLENSKCDENKLARNLKASKARLEANLENLKISLNEAIA